MKAWLAAGAFLALAMLCLTTEATASPYGGMTLEWSEVNGDNKLLRFQVDVLLDASAFGVTPATVGSAILAWDGLTLEFGDGTSESSAGHLMQVTSFDPNTGFFTARLLGLDGQAGLTHVYPAPWQVNGDPWPATLRADARMSAADGHANNPGTVATVVAPIALGDILPEASVKPPKPRVVRCPVDGVCTFEMQGTTATTGPAQTFFPAPGRIDGGAGTFLQPGPPDSDDPLTFSAYGDVEWDTTGAEAGKYYSVQLGYAYDASGVNKATATDFLIYLDPDIPVPPEEPPEPEIGSVGVAFEPPSPCGHVLRVPAGQERLFALQASSDTDGHEVTIQAPMAPYLETSVHDPAATATAEARWLPPRATMQAATFIAHTPGNATAEGSTAYCHVQFEAVELQAFPWAQDGGQDGGGHRLLLEDRTTLPDGATLVAVLWHVDGTPYTGPQVLAHVGDGLHHICLTVDVDIQGSALSDTTCVQRRFATGADDQDQDGANDEADNCPRTPNRSQQDHDGDGIGDACDSSPGAPRAQGDQPTRDLACTGVPETDMDRDGIWDGCDLDLDGDNVPNATDNCPTVANPTQSDRDANGKGDVCDLTRSAPLQVQRALGRHIDAVPASDTDRLPLAMPLWLIGGLGGLFIFAVLGYAAKRLK